MQWRFLSLQLLGALYTVRFVFISCNCVDYVVIGFDMEVYSQCSLTFMRERYLHRCRKQSFAIRAYAVSAVGIDIVSLHKLFAYRVSQNE